MNNPLIDTLFSYDSWANRHLLEECCRLSQEQFEQTSGIGHGNLERTVAHLVGAMFYFTDRLNRKRPRPRPDDTGRSHTPAELLALFNTIDSEFRAAITRSMDAHSPSDLLSWTDEDTDIVDPARQVAYAVALAQMIDHSIHHRTQATDMMRLLGVDLPMEWHPFSWEATNRS